MTHQTPPGSFPDGSGGPRWWAGGLRFLKTHPTGKTSRNWLIWAVVLLLVVGLIDGQIANGARSASANRGTNPTPVTPTSEAETSTASTTSAAAARTVSATPTHHSATPRATPTPVNTAGDIVTAAGVVLPDNMRTPGATNPNVTQADIGSTICVSGWTATIRPSSSYTTGLKEQQLASGYAYRGDTSTGDYEEDHLISLELGGSPASALNLWPEPYSGSDGARTKDQIENRLHSLVCAGALTLASAQRAIASNWWTAYEQYVGTATANPTTAAATTATRTTATTSAPAPVPTDSQQPGCTPLTNAGNCYTEGEFCRTVDRGTDGIAKDGRRIHCTQVGTSWRWEAA